MLCPADAIPEIKALSDYVSGNKAGEGAIRDSINFLAQNNCENVEERISRAIGWILAGEYKDGVLPDGSKYVIQEYMTKTENECVLESHRHHIDVQYIIEGHEEFKTYATNCLTRFGVYNDDKDVDLWQSGMVISQSVLAPGSIIVVYNNQPHKGAIVHRRAEMVKKLVCKIKV